MHYYSVDSEIRKIVHMAIASVALAIPGIFENARTLFNLPVSWGFPLTFSALYSSLYLFIDLLAWKWIAKFLNIPILHGKWNAQGVSSFIDPVTHKNFEFQMDITIKQTFSKIEIFTETKDSTSQSTMASISTNKAMPVFRYSFENTPKNMADQELQRHPGLIELRITNEKLMCGDYFSGKHRLRYGELKLERE